MEILKGGAASGKIKEEVAAMLEEMGGRVPKLAIVRVGENPDDLSYERGAKKKLENFGLRVQSFVYPKEISHEDFMREFQKVNEDEDVDGILLLCPLHPVSSPRCLQGLHIPPDSVQPLLHIRFLSNIPAAPH